MGECPVACDFEVVSISGRRISHMVSNLVRKLLDRLACRKLIISFSFLVFGTFAIRVSNSSIVLYSLRERHSFWDGGSSF